MKETKAWYMNGFAGIIGIAVLVAVAIISLLQQLVIIAALFVVAAIVLASGITIVQPNQAKVLIFFGRYLGTIRDSGLFLTVPLTIRQNVSLRVRNFTSKKLKVNDVQGNPIEIAAVIVFRVIDSAKAVFDVDNYEEFVEIQSEAAIRHVATKYPYDTFTDDDEITLRGNADIISDVLANELQERLKVAGVEVIEARLTHLAYSPEIASAMLQRQQAAAILAARKKIVEGAVSMAQMAIEQLDKEGILELDDERKANMVNNLMVAIVSERATQPVINTGSLY
ncbi:SPFH domain-containing protein [Parageobacillus toebii NBRC 107807]|jgi:regulator of protease activity HflC (stomatin/prohibitin superfamily)|uniref:Regulator of protease activity HflC (Stomatin/prohibitin superfamily) n=1 Tax=Parageobacillus toebii NBRC 107807 TaxID=1223503 RepID=A0A6G9J2W0_9BACL|nr:SPFH domain-containing protein [Parageobacillus toebii]MBB3868816.1 regulator of protease activity HflC (stomatin/prohibitin superfamily) [Parageobacillus toebii NBRC 107807]MED4970439.1 SPFH domain-containing protein [Parageobacillus toebii]QIQ32519.1 SPFH domain-containing protein [Parageobacillus toebii NBRC 107807]QSB48900.1 SPFH domain-containing protein [Parageobacillus toebii]